MILKILRFSVNNLCMRSFTGPQTKILGSTLIQTKRFHHSDIREESIVELPGAKQELGSPQYYVNKSERIQAIKFKKLLLDKGLIHKYRERQGFGFSIV